MYVLNDIDIGLAFETEERERKAVQLKDYDSKREYYQKNPVEYAVDRLGIKRESINWSLLPEYQNHVWDGTENPLMSILDGLIKSEWVGVEAATATSKTFLAAVIVLWFLECFDDSLVVTTAPKESQLTLHIWKEIQKLYPKFNKGELLSLKLRMKPPIEDWIAVGFVAGTREDKETEDKAQGFHAEHMLIIFEETPGIPKSIINTLKLTSQAPHNLILALGNPNHHLDHLHTFCKLKRVRHIRISGLDYPNIVLKDPSFIPGGKSEQGIQDILDDVGTVDAPRYLSRVRGISPAQSIDSLIQAKWCYDAVNRSADKEQRKKLEQGLFALGVDVANSESGDQAALAFGKGLNLRSVEAFQCPDSNQLGKREVKEYIVDHKMDPANVGVDGVGVGAGTINGLKEKGYRVSNLLGGAAPIKISGNVYVFKNLRSQMWWQMREDLKYGIIGLPNDEELIADLCCLTYLDNDKYIIIESKRDAIKRLGRSPNKGDGAVYWNWVRANRRTIKAGNSPF